MSLTPREQEIVELLDSGMTMSEVAESLGISRSTVNAHVQKVAQKIPPSHGPPLRRIVVWSARRRAAL